MITVEPSAAEEVKRLIAKDQGDNMVLRIGVKSGGCSGLSYVLTIEEASPKPNDHVFEQNGVKIIVGAQDKQHLDGVTISYNNSLVGGGFKFHNPQARQSCGCGTSFAA